MTTTRSLTATQTEVLTLATYRPSGSIEPLPARLNQLLLRSKITFGLLARGLIDEAGDDYVINDAGYAAVGRTRKEPAVIAADTEDEAAVAPVEATVAQGTPVAKPKIRENTKQAQVIAMLSRPGGATIADICAETGWMQHTSRGFLAGSVKKKLGLTVTSTKDSGAVRVYRITQRSCL